MGRRFCVMRAKFIEALDPKVRDKFTQKGLKYISCYPYKCAIMNTVNKSHKSWTHVFETHDKTEVEAKCKENDFGFKWRRTDWIEIAQQGPSALKHPETGEHVWFNQAHLFDFNPKLLNWWRYLGTKLLYARKHTLLHKITFADGTPIPRKDLYHILDVLDRNTVRFLWKKGDLLVLDNILTMHGRATYKGKRRILTAMTG